MSSPADVVELVVLLDEDGLAVGTRGAWTNSVCGHPASDDDVHDAVRRRVRAGELPNPLAAEPRRCLVLPPALRGRR
jgi:hypothetical protein